MSDERLANIESSVSGIKSRLDEHDKLDEFRFGSIRNDIKAIHVAVIGNGKPGLGTRVDRMEQVEVRRTWSLRAVWGSIISMVSAYIASHWF